MPCGVHHRHLLRECGYRATPQRLMVLDVIRSTDKHLTAEEIHSALQERYPGVDLSTVYRSLRLFVRLGLVEEHKLGGGRRVYEWRTHPDHGHVLCERCGRLEHLEAALLDPIRHTLERAHRYQVRRVTATVFGLCLNCQDTQQ
ncbi:MAG: Fur family transcriptional regulator [Anaerolineae bacterium]|nr:transcriptional repressor [Thermoflexus sp.]MDW8065139.1 Fur family transcriptional regulator [Anaerolineae bacterium]